MDFCSLIKNLEHLLWFTSLGALGTEMSNSWFLLLRNSYGAGRKSICKWIMKIQEEKLPPSAVNSKLWGMGGKGTQTRWLGFALPTYSLLWSLYSIRTSLSSPKYTIVVSCHCCSLCLKCFLPLSVQLTLLHPSKLRSVTTYSENP